MGKTSFKKMQELSKKLHKKIEKIESGKLGIEDLEEVVEQARELYERLLILKYKAYEKFGEPENSATVEVEEEVEEEVEAVVEETNTVEEEPQEEPEEVSSFDFTGVSEEIEQPSFDFSDMTESEPEKEIEEVEEEEEKETFPEADNVKTQSPIEEEEEETFPEADDVKTKSDLFKASHVEKREKEDENSLNQKLADDEALTLRKKLQSTPITDLKSEISIAKKFEYITFMFGGDNNNYEEAINVLNNCADADEAREKLNEYSNKYKWDLENKSIIKFVELVERRYI
ncbi:hypothetical protein K6119_13455 [Paracrocinitomix mangrovi]|uniref:hypothetical protein n=1 Tax=Paracrocinitomix mangrovi TaxID=2862509 RepID=UPI001C8D3E8B|nr:hypothetical protein [Paracrocinitomix mangrovi]UKN00738.1 hypothetical protein K6119_13455 [Paracrocinitomix mangrovi]